MRRLVNTGKGLSHEIVLNIYAGRAGSFIHPYPLSSRPAHCVNVFHRYAVLSPANIKPGHFSKPDQRRV